MLGLLCNWVLLYAVAYAYLGLIDGERAVREPVTCLYFSIVTWTTLGYGDIRPSMDACCGIGSIAWVYLDGVFYRDVRRIVQAAGRKDFSVLKTRREKQEAVEQLPACQVAAHPAHPVEGSRSPFDRADWAALTQRARHLHYLSVVLTYRKHSLTVSYGLR